MKKVLSLILAIIISLTAFISAVVIPASATSYNSYDVLIENVSSPKNLIGSNISISGTAITSSNYSYSLDYMGWGGTWRPTFLFFVSKNGTKSEFKTTAGAKYIINMEYTITKTAGNDNWGLQVGLFGGVEANGVTNKTSSVRIADHIKYQQKDKDKTFKCSSVYTASSAHNIGFQFAGQGIIDIKSIKILELPANKISDNVAVKYVDNSDAVGEFVAKSSAPKLLSKEGLSFGGWYLNPDFSGEKVMSLTDDTTLYAKWTEGHEEDINKDISVGNILIENISSPKNILGSNISMSGTAITSSNYNYSLDYMGWGGTWRPTFLFFVSKNGTKSEFKTTAGAKYIINMEYTIIQTAGNDNWGLQVGLFGGIEANGVTNKTSSVRIADHIKYQQKDKGKTFNASFVYTAGSVHNIGLQFAGQGIIDIKSIDVLEIPANKINDYVVVTYTDGEKSECAFAKKNGLLKTPEKDGYSFDGWYLNADLSGDAITSVNADTILYAKWVVGAGNVVVTFHNENNVTVKKYLVNDTIDVLPEKDGYTFLGWYKYSNYVGRPVTTAIEGLTDLYAKWEENNPDVLIEVDLSKNTSLTTTGKTADSNVELIDDKLLFDIYNYERQLNVTNASNDSWFPSYYFFNSSGERVELNIGDTYELQVTYKIVDVRAGDKVGLQIGFGADGQPNQTRTKIKGYAMHKSEDEGKEFTYSTSYTAEKFNFGQQHLPKLLFSGQGQVEVISVKIKRILPIIKDTLIGVQTYEEYAIGTESGVLGDKKGTEVSDKVNHTNGKDSNRSLRLHLNTNYLRLSGNTIISLEQDGEMKPYATEKGSAYRITFYMYADDDLNNLTWGVNSVDYTLKGNYLSNFHMETSDKVSLKKGEWKKIVAYIPALKGCMSSRNLLSIAVCSDGYDGKSVYIDDVKVEQLVDSEVVLFNTNGGNKLDPQRAFAGQPFVSFREPIREGYLFDGWYYDSEYKKEAKLSDKFPSYQTEITLYAKWISAPTVGMDFTAGSFDSEIYKNNINPYENTVADMDSAIDFYNNKSMTGKVAWVKDAGIYGNGKADTDGALAFCNDLYSSYNDLFGYNVVRLVNEDGTPFTVVKGERYTIDFDYIFASHKGLSYIIPVISEYSAYTDIGYDSFQTIGRVSVMETDTDYMNFKQSFVAERTGYVYLALTGRDDNANVDTHCYEKVYVDNLNIKLDPNVTKLTIKYGNTTWYTLYGIKGEKLTLANAVKEGADTFDGFYWDSDFKNKFDEVFPEKDSTIYIKLKKDKYDVPSDFSKPIVLDFEETELLEDFYRQQKYMTSWAREVEKEWSLETNDAKNALSGNNYIKLRGFSHYWNQAKFALYDPKHPENVMLLDKGGKYRITVMVRCEDMYESPVNMTVSLENPSQKHLLAENGNVKLEYTPEGDKNGYFMFVGDIEVSSEMSYYPSLAIRRNANDLQSIFIDTVSVEKLRDCTVKFEENGGSTVEDAVVQIHDPVFDPGIPYKEGFVFDGWFADSAFSKKWDFDNDTVENDITLYGKWSAEIISEEDNDYSNNHDTEADTELEGSISNGNAPNLLDADKVIIEKENDNNDVSADSGVQIWLIVIACIGSLLILFVAMIVVIILIRKRKNKKV